MRHIERDGYHVLDWAGADSPCIPDLCAAAPELALGRFLVNTSFDSGFLTLTPEEVSAGWRIIGRLAHSPRLSAVSQLPHDQFDEWLAFDAPVEMSDFETMVNYPNFTPIDFDWIEKRELFWQQILRWRPSQVFAENDGAYVLTRDDDVARRLECI